MILRHPPQQSIRSPLDSLMCLARRVFGLNKRPSVSRLAGAPATASYEAAISWHRILVDQVTTVDRISSVQG
jgi:hypothetical protein